MDVVVAADDDDIVNVQRQALFAREFPVKCFSGIKFVSKLGLGATVSR